MAVENAAEELLSGLAGYPRDVPRRAPVWVAVCGKTRLSGDKIDYCPRQVWPQGIDGVVAGLQWDHPVLINHYWLSGKREPFTKLRQSLHDFSRFSR